ncbi:MAG: hypothetical protein CO093_11645 [Alphaproteobacteria bacterium CG_4_9_14_3_um_filter_47_13]|nr:MAG: hypothetical protein CO093_11645 [Alphaproteobacteria bacterium CG_4_9_14_3_um_filter_47_13]
MLFVTFKIFISALVIAFSSWLSEKKPELAGFLVALPLVTLLVLPFSFLEYQNTEASTRFAQSIFTAIPLTLVFFVPFLFAARLHLGFWWLYGSGLALLIAAYFLHKWILSLL